MLLQASEIKSCYIGPEISPEEFIQEHFFLYLGKGIMHGYDGHKHYTLNEGEYCLVRKNHLARYNKERVNNAFEKVVVIFDEPFLKSFADKHQPVVRKIKLTASFIPLHQSKTIPAFIHSLMPYYDGFGKIKTQYADKKREELLLLLLKSNPVLAGILFDFNVPHKINIESFMNRNFRFNVAIQRFVYLTGRSISSFKRDFTTIFNETPGKWLTQKRLQEAYFLMDKKGKKPSDVYLEVGFEDLSHFSFAFKKQFGVAPTQIQLAR